MIARETVTEMMGLALEQAELAAELGEVPVGAVIVSKGKVIARAHNEVESTKDPSAHAEILAIKRAADVVGDWRLNQVELYVTLEPCTMCIGAIKLSRISTLVFGASDERLGACGSLYDLVQDKRNGPVARVISGVREQESIDLLQKFFKEKRS